MRDHKRLWFMSPWLTHRHTHGFQPTVLLLQPGELIVNKQTKSKRPLPTMFNKNCKTVVISVILKCTCTFGAMEWSEGPLSLNLGPITRLWPGSCLLHTTQWKYWDDFKFLGLIDHRTVLQQICHEAVSDNLCGPLGTQFRHVPGHFNQCLCGSVVGVCSPGNSVPPRSRPL